MMLIYFDRGSSVLVLVGGGVQGAVPEKRRLCKFLRGRGGLSEHERVRAEQRRAG